MNEFSKEEAYKIYEQDKQLVEAAKIHCEQLGIPYEDRYRSQLSRYIAKVDSGETVGVSEASNSKPAKVLPFSAIDADGQFMNEKQTCEKYNLPYNKLKKANLVSHTSKITWNMEFAYTVEDVDHFANFKDKLIEEVGSIAKNLPKVVRKPNSPEGHLLVIDPADIHLGKLCDPFSTGNTYNVQIAIDRVMEGISSILSKCSGFNIDQILFVAGNDCLHSDTIKGATTKGTQQDTDGLWYMNFLAAKDLYISVIKQLSDVANVHVVYNPSNHDYQSGFFLCDVVKTFFRNFENITFDVDLRHRKYYNYFENLIGTTHGDCGKPANLPLMMAEESKDWSKCKHRYIYTHHVHHKQVKDHIGVTIESIRSPSGTDIWHSNNMYAGVPKAIEGFLHDKNRGQVCRITHTF